MFKEKIDPNISIFLKFCIYYYIYNYILFLSKLISIYRVKTKIVYELDDNLIEIYNFIIMYYINLKTLKTL